jgi:hypothetical protein
MDDDVPSPALVYYMAYQITLKILYALFSSTITLHILVVEEYYQEICILLLLVAFNINNTTGVRLEDATRHLGPAKYENQIDYIRERPPKMRMATAVRFNADNGQSKVFISHEHCKVGGHIS